MKVDFSIGASIIPGQLFPVERMWLYTHFVGQKYTSDDKLFSIMEI